MNWGAEDFAWAAFLVVGGGTFLVLAARRSSSRAWRLGVVLALAAAFLLAWAQAAVGVIGDGGHPANRLFHGVLLVAALGALASRWRPRGMALAMAITAAAQALATCGAWAAGLPVPWAVCLVFAAMWLVSAALFRHAARQTA